MNGLSQIVNIEPDSRVFGCATRLFLSLPKTSSNAENCQISVWNIFPVRAEKVPVMVLGIRAQAADLAALIVMISLELDRNREISL